MGKTIVEAGHFYSVHGPTAASVAGWQIGKEHVNDLPGSELTLFIDDYHDSQPYLEAGDTIFPPEVAEKIARDMIAGAEHVFSEAEIAKGAAAKLQVMLDSGQVTLKKGVVSAGGVRLGTLAYGSIESFQPTCVFLDFLLLHQKAKLGSHQVTVLPESYASQQHQLATILGKIAVPNLVSYKAVFHGLEAEKHTVQIGVDYEVIS